MLRIPACLAATLAACSVSLAGGAERPTAFDGIIARQAKAHGVPESFVHRTVMRESRYNPRVIHNHCYGLMQIKHATARSMGYKGDPRGLLDPETNLTFAIPYLANAYRLADGDEGRATALFRGGYYYFAKRKGMLASLQTASSQPSRPESTSPAAPPPDPVMMFFSFLAGAPAETAAPAPSQASPLAVPQQSPQTSAAVASLAGNAAPRE